ncbi:MULTISPECIES: ribonuclease P protein component [Galbibacter]|uniref:Ribonuclease P protein component n=1 Tax=Galbibacter pacificus TaxID=2996052 RepID=A0ABT6FS23_9FLAO|nr:ribonuclease P protein component [Galbibacter pacificus]MDG3582974.1 ribonuclease P protein component [Galbibacter pacificus]MDG3585907.1 ribonuclease P protein component [Galbibacter pacificus]
MDRSFSKEERLKNKILIGTLFSEGSSVSKYPLRLIYMRAQETEGAKLKAAVSVSKRSFKKAVDRNRIKRLVREAYRLNKHLFIQSTGENPYLFMLLYTGKEIPSFKKLNSILQKLHEKFDAHIKE